MYYSPLFVFCSFSCKLNAFTMLLLSTEKQEKLQKGILPI